MARTVLLFDIDMTLMRSGGAGLIAMNRAFEELTGVPVDSLSDVDGGDRRDTASRPMEGSPPVRAVPSDSYLGKR
jgi:phosphoglycolate phosphatase-like HAD superfamily hydrolase